MEERGNSYLGPNRYLSNRKHYVNYNRTNSSSSYTIYAVLQGSKLGPFLLIINVNDIINVSGILFPVTCAEIQMFLLPGVKKINNKFSNLNLELKEPVQWLNNNKLSLKGHIPRYLLISINFGICNIKHDFI